MKVTNNPAPNPYQTDTKIEGAKNSQKSAKNQAIEAFTTSSHTGVRSGAEVEISDTAKLMRQASEIARETGDVRSDKVSALKKSIQDGTYEIDARAIADRLVDEHLGADFGKNNL